MANLNDVVGKLNLFGNQNGSSVEKGYSVTQSIVPAPIPRAIVVGNKPYEVRSTIEEWNAGVNAGEFDADNWGSSHHKEGIIYIRPGVCREEQKDTLLHEALHCCYHKHGVNLWNVKDKVNDLEEYTINVITPWLLLILQDNPELRDYLFS